jgi:hypothetical protein
MENRTKDSRSGAQEVQAAETMYRQEIKKISKETQASQSKNRTNYFKKTALNPLFLFRMPKRNFIARLSSFRILKARFT